MNILRFNGKIPPFFVDSLMELPSHPELFAQNRDREKVADGLLERNVVFGF